MDTTLRPRTAAVDEADAGQADDNVALEVRLYVDGHELLARLSRGQVAWLREAVAAPDAHERVLRIWGMTLQIPAHRWRLARASQVRIGQATVSAVQWPARPPEGLEELSAESAASVSDEQLAADQWDLTDEDARQARARDDETRRAWRESRKGSRRAILNEVPPGYMRTPLTPPRTQRVQALVQWDGDPEATWTPARALGWTVLPTDRDDMPAPLRGATVVQVHLEAPSEVADTTSPTRQARAVLLPVHDVRPVHHGDGDDANEQRL